MKLSEAIREGAKLHPETTGHLVQFTNGQVCTCALGAALAAGDPNYFEHLADFVMEYPNRNDEEFISPIGAPRAYDHLYAIFPEAKDSVPKEEFSLYKQWLWAGQNNPGFDILEFVWRLNDRGKRSREYIAQILERMGY